MVPEGTRVKMPADSRHYRDTDLASIERTLSIAGFGAAPQRHGELPNT